MVLRKELQKKGYIGGITIGHSGKKRLSDFDLALLIEFVPIQSRIQRLEI